jgi:hypothetical protein
MGGTVGPTSIDPMKLEDVARLGTERRSGY